MNPARRTLDPRAKLYLLLVANLMLFFHVGLATQIVMVVLFLLPLLAAARWRTALNFGVTYAVLTALGMLDPDALGLPWLHVVSALAVGVTMMLPCFITGAYTFTTTSASAFICAMRRMRVPESVVIPCVVVIRFFPTIAEDYRQIRNAMALRGRMQLPLLGPARVAHSTRLREPSPPVASPLPMTMPQSRHCATSR